MQVLKSQQILFKLISEKQKMPEFPQYLLIRHNDLQ